MFNSLTSNCKHYPMSYSSILSHITASFLFRGYLRFIV
ncbi:hypothetical protein FM106_31470 [Brachybacterium faecium]|nr:hypothetical protein FM106_31470 [Brachybacterium faecium]